MAQHFFLPLYKQISLTEVYVKRFWGHFLKIVKKYYKGSSSLKLASKPAAGIETQSGSEEHKRSNHQPQFQVLHRVDVKPSLPQNDQP